MDPDAGPHIAPDAAPDAAIPALPPSCELTQAPLAQPADANTVLVTPDTFFIGDDRGLWRSSRIDQPFERVKSLDSGPVTTLVRTDDGAIFAVLGEGSVMTSTDEGEHWEALADLPPNGGSTIQRLHTDGERVVGLVGAESIATLYDLDRATGLWTEIVAEAPVEGWGHSGFSLVGIDRGALLATPSGYRAGGLFRLERGAARWQLIPDLEANGFTTFARNGDASVAATQLGIWAEIESGAYRRVLSAELVHPVIVTTADGFFGVDGHNVLRSTDGLSWRVEPLEAAPPAVVSESNGRIPMLRGDGGSVSLSDDRGGTWNEPLIVSQTFERISLHGDGDARISYVSSSPAWWSDGAPAWQQGEWTRVTWPVRYASAVAMTDTGAWACSYEGCAHRTDDGEVGPMIAIPESDYAHEAAAAFATSHGLFLSPRPYGTSCGAVQPGLVVLRDEAAGTWEDASTGLRSWSPDCAGTPSVAMVSTMFELDGVLWATQAQDYLEPAFEPVVLRSDDGREWSEVREGAELVALVRADTGAYGLFRPGVVEALSGGSFSPVREQPGEPGDLVTDLVALDGRLIAATRDASGSSLWMSTDGACSWQALLVEERIGPIADLDARGSVLAIASSTSGLWEATGCFAP